MVRQSEVKTRILRLNRVSHHKTNWLLCSCVLGLNKFLVQILFSFFLNYVPVFFSDFFFLNLVPLNKIEKLAQGDFFFLRNSTTGKEMMVFLKNHWYQ